MLGILIAVAAAMLWSGHPSGSGRMLRRWLVERPAAWLSRASFVRVASVVLALIAIAAVVHLFEGEGLRLAATSLAEGMAWFMAFDVATYIEAYAVLWLLGASRLARTALGAVRALSAQAGDAARRAWRGCVRQVSNRGRRDGPRAPRDEDPEPAAWPGLALAA